MNTPQIKGLLARGFLASSLLTTSQLLCAANFVVQDIEVNGLERVTAGTVLNYIPANVGEAFDDANSADIIRSLYQTGLFEDVIISRRGNILVVNVQERPAIGEINFSGNKAFKSKQLIEVLRKADIAKGRTLDKSAVLRIQRELKEQYLAQGKYGVEIETTLDVLPRNRRAINIKIYEGKTSRIQRVKIIGNKAFTEKRLLNLLDSGEKKSWALLSKRDRYAKQKLVGDLDTLISFYQDQGYLNFEVVSTQVALTPDKKSTYITLNIHEGDKYKIAAVDIVGDLNVPQKQLNAMVSIAKGQTYSQKRLEETRKNLEKQLGKKGYAFAQTKVDKRIDNITKTVDIKLVVLSGSRAYVRRINIKGNYRTRDDVYRREMRQLESSWYSKEAIERSKVRIQRLPYVEYVSIAKTPVAGSRDQVDLEVTIKERLSNQFSIGAGFSQNQGFLFNASLKQENFMGTGKRLFLGIENSKSIKNYNVTYTNPYYTVDGISRGFTAYLNEFDGEEGLVSDYISNRYGGDVHYTIPLNETDSVRFSVGAEHREIKTTSETPQHVKDFLVKHGNSYDQFLGTLAYTRDTRDRTIFPTKGQKQSLSLEMALPSSDLEYNKIRYNGAFYAGFGENFIFAAKAKVAVGKGTGDLDGLPFYQKFYGGGLRSVRGFEQNSLGPRDSNDRPKGGDLATSASAELLFPAPFMTDNKSIRMSAFVDAGNVFAGTGDFDSAELRYSAGIGMVWLSPVGPFSVSYAKPLNAKENDKEQNFQFSLGASF